LPSVSAVIHWLTPGNEASSDGPVTTGPLAAGAALSLAFADVVAVADVEATGFGVSFFFPQPVPTRGTSDANAT
jgi:hypothetical protein